MKSDQYQDKYNEVFQKLKQEKMNWDFEDFLKKNNEPQNKSEGIIPIQHKKTLFQSKIMWLAASVILIGGIFFGTQLWNQQPSHIDEQNKMVQNEVERQRKEIFEANTIAAVEDTLQNVKTFTEDTISHEVSNPDEVINKIVPKRGRLKKINNERYTQNDQNNIQRKTANVPEYQDNYVIINGHKIKNEEEAINVTKYSFQMLSQNVAKTIASSVVQEMPDNE